MKMQHALKALIACPQNNLKVFLDGQPVQLADDASSLHQVAAVAHQAINPCLHPTDAAKTVELLASLLQGALSTTGTKCFAKTHVCCGSLLGALPDPWECKPWVLRMPLLVHLHGGCRMSWSCSGSIKKPMECFLQSCQQLHDQLPE